MSEIAIIATGVANTASVRAAFTRLGAAIELTRDPERVRSAARVVLPGVGSFGSGMSMLRAHNLCDPIRERALQDRPLLAICLGMQLLCNASEESPDIDGLGIIDAPVRRFPERARVPQFGWNSVEANERCHYLRSGCAYYANSYRIDRAPGDWSCAVTDHAGPFIGAVERGSTLACQFHPEISGAWGQSLLSRWLSENETRSFC